MHVFENEKIFSKKCKKTGIECQFWPIHLKIGVAFFENSIFKGGIMDENNQATNDLEQDAISTRARSRKKDVVAYSKNPFWKVTEVAIGTKRVTIAGGFISKEQTGETVSIAGIHRIEDVDEDRFVKLFTQNSALFFDLSKPAQKLLRFILDVVQDNHGKDGIYFSWWEVEDWLKAKAIAMKGFSRTNYHRALAEIIGKKLIAESDRPNYYWINPHVFFNGDRLVYIQEYRKIPKAKPKAEIAKNDAAIRAELERRGQMRLEAPENIDEKKGTGDE